MVEAQQEGVSSFQAACPADGEERMAKRLEGWARRGFGHHPSACERLAILLPILTYSVVVGLGGAISLILTGPSVWTLLIVGGGMGVLLGFEPGTHSVSRISLS